MHCSRGYCCLLLAGLLVVIPVAVNAYTGESVRLSAEYATLDIALTGGTIRNWRACRTTCDSTDAVTTVFTDNAPAVTLIAIDNPSLTERLRSLHYTVQSPATLDAATLHLQSEPLTETVRVEQNYRVDNAGRLLTLAVRLTGPGAAEFTQKNTLALRLHTGAAFNRPRSAGFTGVVETTRIVSLTDGEVTRHSTGESWRMPNGNTAWSGIRNRFWTMMATTPAGFTATAGKPLDNGNSIAITPLSRDLQFTIYAGPVEPAMLSEQPGGLKGLWISAIWDWLRALAAGLYYLLEKLTALTGHYGLAIVLLALAVKILMLPLTLIAARWQHQVNTVKARLQPELRRIKAEYRGEEQAERMLALHREHGVSLLYPVKSLFGVLIQLPVFIAVFDMLLHHPGLAGSNFLWIEDLARPDRLMALPFALPFFGGYLNLLPFLMTAINLLGAFLTGSAGLGILEHRGQQRQLYIMALAFLVLFYTFPAGMVLYWTCTNLFHVLGEQGISRLRQYAAGMSSTSTN